MQSSHDVTLNFIDNLDQALEKINKGEQPILNLFPSSASYQQSLSLFIQQEQLTLSAPQRSDIENIANVKRLKLKSETDEELLKLDSLEKSKINLHGTVKDSKELLDSEIKIYHKELQEYETASVEDNERLAQYKTVTQYDGKNVNELEKIKIDQVEFLNKELVLKSTKKENTGSSRKKGGGATTYIPLAIETAKFAAIN